MAAKDPFKQTIRVSKIKCICTPDNICVVDSYKIKYDKAALFCENLEFMAPFEYFRTHESWTRELIAHKMLYDMKLLQDHTKDTDLNEEESLFRLVGYSILYFVYNVGKFFGGFKDA